MKTRGMQRTAEKAPGLRSGLYAVLLGTLLALAGCQTTTRSAESEAEARSDGPTAREEIASYNVTDFENTYTITHTSSEYTSLYGVYYSEWYVAFKDENNADNAYYGRKHIDISGILLIYELFLQMSKKSS